MGGNLEVTFTFDLDFFVFFNRRAVQSDLAGPSDLAGQRN